MQARLKAMHDDAAGVRSVRGWRRGAPLSRGCCALLRPPQAVQCPPVLGPQGLTDPERIRACIQAAEENLRYLQAYSPEALSEGPSDGWTVNLRGPLCG